jgi:hypothetical protein
MKYNATFFVESVVPGLVKYVCQESRRQTLRGIMVHLDNTRLYNSRKVRQLLLQQKSVKFMPPAYSPHLYPSGFFLFGMIKDRMLVTSSSSPYEPISAISELIASHPKDQLVCIYKKLNEASQLGD